MDGPVLKEVTGSSNLLDRYQQALILWCRCNDAHERLTKSMFEARSDSRAVENQLDQLDQLRLQAMEVSRELLDSPPPG